MYREICIKEYWFFFSFGGVHLMINGGENGIWDMNISLPMTSVDWDKLIQNSWQAVCILYNVISNIH